MGVEWKELMKCYGWYFEEKLQVIPEGYSRRSVMEFYGVEMKEKVYKVEE